VGAYVRQYPERLVALLLSRRLSDKTALSDCSALRREIYYGHHLARSAAVLVPRRLRDRDRDRSRESALA